MRWPALIIILSCFLLACTTPEERELETLDQRLDALIEVSLSPDPLPGLLEALADPFPEVRRFALTDLPRLGPDAREAIPKVTAMAREDPDDAVRGCAAEVLAALTHAGTPGPDGDEPESPAQAR